MKCFGNGSPDESGHRVTTPSAGPSHVVPSLGHVTCSGQLDIRKCEASRGLMSKWELGSSSFDNCHHVSKLTLIP